MRPTEHYQQLIEQGVIEHDDRQSALTQELDRLYRDLTSHKVLSRFRKQDIQGLYVWGGVGTGKSFLVDNFYHCLPIEDKLRIHFHRFMDIVHQELKAHTGHRDPLSQVADEFAKRARIVCIDELIVNDIVDAMVLAGLFAALYERGICLVFTGNIKPDKLYIRGLQRQRFLPAIELIKQHSVVFHLNSPLDYRSYAATTCVNYYFPLSSKTDDKMCERFLRKAGVDSIESGVIKLLGRDVDYVAKAPNIIWFDFIKICGVPRSQKDFLRLSKQYQIILISDVMKIKADETDLVRSFINLIDVMYDAKIKLIISAQVDTDQLYIKGKLLFPFARTMSRLLEMRTAEWPDKLQR